MNEVEDDPESTVGSIATTQSYPNGKMPTPVRVLRCVWQSTKGADGKSYGRTQNEELLRLRSGTTALSPLDIAELQRRGLKPGEVDAVNLRLQSMAARASVHVEQVSTARAVKSIGAAVSLAHSYPVVRMALHGLLADAASRLGKGDRAASERSAETQEPSQRGEGQAGSRLLSALQTLNRAAGEVQLAYRQLVKGEEPPAASVLEFQRSWFLVQAMVEALRGRDCFYRPGGWSELKQQVMVNGIPWRKGDPVRKKSDAGAA